MSVVPVSPAAEWVVDVARVTAVTSSWLATVLATAIVCRPWPGTEMLVPVVVVAAVAVVMLFGGLVGATLTLTSATLLAMTLWGQTGGAVLVVATIAALHVLPVHAVHVGPRGGAADEF